MALSLKVLGPQNTGVVDSFVFYPGEERTLKLQLFDFDNSNPFDIPSGSDKSLFLPGSPLDVEIPDGSIIVDSSDASIFTVNLTEAQTAQMISGDIRFQFIHTSVTRIAYREVGIKKLNMVV